MGAYIENKWYLACLNEELDGRNPLPKKMLGRELVIFRTASGRIGVTEDRCCHRNVNLSLGQVQGERIKYKSIPAVCAIRTYKVRTDYKAVWVFFGDEALADSVPLPPMPEMDRLPRVYNYHYFDADLKLVAE
eukprot:gene17021-21703_t